MTTVEFIYDSTVNDSLGASSVHLNVCYICNGKKFQYVNKVSIKYLSFTYLFRDSFSKLLYF